MCEIFLFHLHSKVNSSTAAMKELPFDVKLPPGFFAKRENGNSSTHEAEQNRLNREVAEHFAANSQHPSAAHEPEDEAETEMVDEERSVGGDEFTVKSVSHQGSSRIEIKTKKRKSNQLDEISGEKTNSSPKSEDEGPQAKVFQKINIEFFDYK